MIQKWLRGFFVRTRLDRINRAAGYLQGYLRMKWLTKYFKMMKTSALKIQKFARKYLFRKKIIEEREKGFYSKPGNEVDVLRGVENNVIFGQKKAIQAIDPEKLPVTLSWFKKSKSLNRKSQI